MAQDIFGQFFKKIKSQDDSDHEDNLNRKEQIQFSINKSFGSNDFANTFNVWNPQKSDKGDFVIYNVDGKDKEGKFFIKRRYKEFLVLR